MDKFFQNVNPSSEFSLTAVISSLLWFYEDYMCPNLAFIWLCKEWNGLQEILISDVFKGEYKFIIINAQIFLMAKSPAKNMTFSQCEWAYISSVQSLSHVWLFVTPWIAARQASLSITNSQSLLKHMSIKSVMPSSHLTLCCPLLLLPPIPPSIRVFSNESTLHMRWPKYWSFSFSISPCNEHPGLISFRMDWLDLFAVQGTLKSLLQHHSSKASILRCSAFFRVQLSHPYMTTGKTIALTRWTFVGKVMSLLFNMLSTLVITFLPRSKHVLISWLQSPSAVVLEPPKIKSDTVSTVDPSVFHDVMGPDAMILVLWMLSFKLIFFTLLFHVHQEAF